MPVSRCPDFPRVRSGGFGRLILQFALSLDSWSDLLRALIWRDGRDVMDPAAVAPPWSGDKVVVADEDQRGKLAPGGDIRAQQAWRGVGGGRARPGDVPLAEMMATGGIGLEAPPVAAGPAAPLVLIFTSGTTGAPKGVPVPVRALAGMGCYMQYGLDGRPGDGYWNAAAPGEAYCLYCATLGPVAGGTGT